MSIFGKYKFAFFKVIRKLGKEVSNEEYQARMKACATADEGSVCQHMGNVNPYNTVLAAGCNLCGCPFETKGRMKTISGQIIKCPHPKGNQWESLKFINDMDNFKLGVGERGLAIANTDNTTSMVNLTHADYVDVPTKLDEITLATTGNFVSFVFNGNTVVLPNAIDIASGVDAIKAAIEAEVEKVEYSVWVYASYEAGNLTIKHEGHFRLESIAVSDVASGAQQATTLKSQIVSKCKYSAENVVGQIGPVYYNGSTQALGNDPYNYAGDANDATTATSLASALSTALVNLGITVIGSVTVTVNNGFQGFDISFEAVQPAATIKLTGSGANKLIGETGCTRAFN